MYNNEIMDCICKITQRLDKIEKAIHIHPEIYLCDSVGRIMLRLDRIEHLIIAIGDKMAVDLTKLIKSLQENTDAENAVETLLTTLTAEIKRLAALSSDPALQAQLDALANDVSAKAATLSAAVVANTLPGDNPNP